MSRKKKKMPKLTDRQYSEYIAALRARDEKDGQAPEN